MSVRNITAELAIQLNCDVGEGPVWDTRDGTLYFVDVTPGKIYHFDPLSSSLTSHSFGQEVGAAVPAAGGGLIVAARDGIYTLSADGVGSMLINLEGDQPQLRMNDAKVDSKGRLWAGTMAFDFSAGVANLYRIQGAVADLVLADLTVSNGLGWSPDKARMYFIDSATYRIDEFDFDLEAGEISNRRPFVTLEVDSGMPDGLTVDAGGNVWVAHFGTGVVKGYSPSGTLQAIINLPVTQVTSCTFGGSELETLYITTAAYQLSDEELEAQPLAGSVFRCETGTTGIPATLFGSLT